MSYDRNRRGARRPTTHEWSEKTVLSFRSPTGEIFFHPADAATQTAFYGNLKNPQTGNLKFDPGAFAAVATQVSTTSINSGSPIAVLTLDDLRSALKPGETLFTGYEPDGATRTCGVCGQNFQPVRIPFVHKDGTPGIGGNFATLAATKLSELVAKGGELATRVEASSTAMTAEVMGTEPVPSRARLIPVCKSCREVLGVPTFALETAKSGLLGAAQRIGVVADRFAAAEILGRGNRGHASGASDYRGRRPNDRRPEKPKVDWHGAQLETATAAALTAAGYTKPSEVLALTEDQMIEKGFAHAGSVKPIRFALQRASAGSAPPNFVGRGSAAPGAVPGDSRRPTKIGGKKQPRKKEFTTPRRSDGGGVGLDSLRD